MSGASETDGAQANDLVERMRRMMERAIEQHGPDSAAVEMCRETIERLEQPVSAQATFESAFDSGARR